MSESVEIKIATVKEDDFDPVVPKDFNDEAGVEGIADLVSKTGEISYLDLTSINIPNVLLIIDGMPINSKGSYNFSIQIYPIFGTAVFMQFVVDADGKAIAVDMDDETLATVGKFVKEQKEVERDSGLRESIIADINKYGRDGYIKRMDNMFMEDSLEEEYERAKVEQQKSKESQ